MLPVFGLAGVPLYLAPFASLIVTSLLIPKASFLGHLSGILAGYLLSFRLLDPLGPWGALGLLAAALAGARGGWGGSVVGEKAWGARAGAQG